MDNAVKYCISNSEIVSLAWNGSKIPIQVQMLFYRDKWLSPLLSALERLILNRIEK